MIASYGVALDVCITLLTILSYPVEPLKANQNLPGREAFNMLPALRNSAYFSSSSHLDGPS